MEGITVFLVGIPSKGLIRKTVQPTHNRKSAVFRISCPLRMPTKKTVHAGLRRGCRAGREIARDTVATYTPIESKNRGRVIPVLSMYVYVYE